MAAPLGQIMATGVAQPRFGQETALDPSNATILLIGGRVVSNYNIDINSHDENSGRDDATGYTGLMFTF
ncbi:MAG: hypothetical protein CMJ20_02080 [Phycisphaeraceae bacterium]|nr:hypothetical protein [Phycisphaeraceae bacterium]